MRKALEVVDQLKQIGVLFVPIPVLSKKDHQQLTKDLDRRLGAIIKGVEV